jgi:thioredoxin-like negative regulator of GroEL
LANASASGSWASVGHGNGKEQMMLMDRGLGGDYLSRQHMAHMAQMHGAGNPTWALSDIQLGDIVTPDQAKQIVRIVVVKSDHCGWCKKLQADVLDHVKAYYDIDVLTVQEAQAAQVPFDGQGVPQTIVFVNGAVKGTFKGYSPKDSWIAQVQKVIHGA